ncbi:uronyl 2-sulfotransferase-like [Antedon mediterranea]|uniref:uronyl 2-sulfotransferase-like n=1 Tax=Antedon mediterranea TaxID=105859 RepID=UPI003AF4E2D3
MAICSFVCISKRIAILFGIFILILFCLKFGTIQKQEKLNPSSKVECSLSISSARNIFWDERKETIQNLPFSATFKNKSGVRIIFNRVPKCGSRSLVNVVQNLVDQNQVNLIHSQVYNKTELSEAQKSLIVDVLPNLDPPFVFHRHMFYIDFRKHSIVPVKYINIIRDPIERATSEYYFRRFGDEETEKDFKGSDLYQTINECVLGNKAECIGNNLQYIIPFFCGDSPECLTLNSRVPLEIAKQNVERDFIMVGLLEDFRSTVAVLEKLLPEVFNGAANYLTNPNTNFNCRKGKYVTKYKVPPTDEVRAILYQEMALEYEFFEFIKQRLNKQKQSLGI